MGAENNKKEMIIVTRKNTVLNPLKNPMIVCVCVGVESVDFVGIKMVVVKKKVGNGGGPGGWRI